MKDPGDGVARPVLVLAGPTASGKSSAAVAIAERTGGVVINADALQVYRELPILTAQPQGADLMRAPHRLYGALDGAQACSAARWRALALAEIAACPDRLPIVVGGTGLYLLALLQGLSDMPRIDPALRARAIARRNALGPAAFHAEVAAMDPATGAKLPPGDTQRLVRAWEVFAATGRPFSEWMARPRDGPPAHLTFHSVILLPERAYLYRQIDRRFAAMVQGGALEEMRASRHLPDDAPVMKALGAAELRAYLRGKTTLEQAVSQAQQASRHYAKRQITWFRHQLPVAKTLNTQDYYQLLDQLFSIIRHFELTGPYGLT